MVSTTGARPQERLTVERDYLIPLPETAFDPHWPETRRVLSDCTVSYHGARYSVPYPLVGSVVTVKADPLGRTLEIFAGAEPVATHPRLARAKRSICEQHVADLRKPRWERVRRQTPKARASQPPKTPDPVPLVSWPTVEVEQRPIEHYAAAIGGAR